jgi:hypothetical protein
MAYFKSLKANEVTLSLRKNHLKCIKTEKHKNSCADFIKVTIWYYIKMWCIYLCHLKDILTKASGVETISAENDKRFNEWWLNE